MSQEKPESLDLIPLLEEKWKAYRLNEEEPDWRALPGVERLDREDMVNLCLADIELKVEFGKRTPPLAPEYAAAAGRFGLDQEGLFALIEGEYRWCWKHNLGQPQAALRSPVPRVKKAEYELLFRGSELEGRIREQLKLEWTCSGCGRTVQGEEGDNLHCVCGCRAERTTILPAVGAPAGPDDPAAAAYWPPPVQTLGGTSQEPRFQLIRLLGWGGMGVVYEARDNTAPERRLAIKLLRPERCGDPATRQRFQREWQALASVPGPHVVQAHEFGEEKGDGVPYLYLVMEYLEGDTLADRLQSGQPLPMHDVQKIAREAALGLAAIHRQNLVHRDVKPGNLKLVPLPGSGWRTVLMDLGLVLSGDPQAPLTQEGAILGTLTYMAPEQASGRPDGRADLFGLGCTLYHAATGRPPFHGPTPQAALLAVASHVPDPPHRHNPLVPPEFSSLVMRLLEKDPKRRPQSALEVVEALEQPSAASARKAPPDRRVFLGSGLAVGAAVFGAGAWLMSRVARPHNVGAETPHDPGSGGGEESSHEPRPLAIRPLRVFLYEPVPKEEVAINHGLIGGAKSPRARFGDEVTITVELSEPAYLYLIGFNFNGDEQLL
jgi:serine/threonine protein kinase